MVWRQPKAASFMEKQLETQLTQQLTQCSKMTQQLVSLLQLLQLYRETKSSADPGGAEASSFGAAPQQPLSGSMSRRRQTNPLLSVK